MKTITKNSYLSSSLGPQDENPTIAEASEFGPSDGRTLNPMFSFSREEFYDKTVPSKSYQESTLSLPWKSSKSTMPHKRPDYVLSELENDPKAQLIRRSMAYYESAEYRYRDEATNANALTERTDSESQSSGRSSQRRTSRQMAEMTPNSDRVLRSCTRRASHFSGTSHDINMSNRDIHSHLSTVITKTKGMSQPLLEETIHLDNDAMNADFSTPVSSARPHLSESPAGSYIPTSSTQALHPSKYWRRCVSRFWTGEPEDSNQRPQMSFDDRSGESFRFADFGKKWVIPNIVGLDSTPRRSTDGFTAVEGLGEERLRDVMTVTRSESPTVESGTRRRLAEASIPSWSPLLEERQTTTPAQSVISCMRDCFCRGLKLVLSLLFNSLATVYIILYAAYTMLVSGLKPVTKLNHFLFEWAGRRMAALTADTYGKIPVLSGDEPTGLHDREMLKRVESSSIFEPTSNKRGQRPYVWKRMLFCFLVGFILLVVFLLYPSVADRHEEEGWLFVVLPSKERCHQLISGGLPSESSFMFRSRCLISLVKKRLREWVSRFQPSTPISHDATSEDLNNFEIKEKIDNLRIEMDQKLAQVLRRLKEINGLSVNSSHLLSHLLSAEVPSLSPDQESGGLSGDLILSALQHLAERSLSGPFAELKARIAHFSDAFSHLQQLSLSQRIEVSEKLREVFATLETLKTAVDSSALSNQGIRVFEEKTTLAHHMILENVSRVSNEVENIIARLNALEQLNSNMDTAVKRFSLELESLHTERLRTIEELKLSIEKELNFAIESIKVDFANAFTTLSDKTEDNHLNTAGLDYNLDSTLLSLLNSSEHESITKSIIGNLSAFKNATEVMRAIVETALAIHSADRLARADFALESAGGSVVSTRCTRTYTKAATVVSFMGMPLARISKSPNTILQPSTNPGECWAFHGSEGSAIIRLAMPVYITAVSLEHIPKQLSLTGSLDSAPKDFQIKALSSENDEDGQLLATFTYNIDGPPIQIFSITERPLHLVMFVELVVLNNHGNPEYTCIYRVRVHGHHTKP